MKDHQAGYYIDRNCYFCFSRGVGEGTEVYEQAKGGGCTNFSTYQEVVFMDTQL